MSTQVEKDLNIFLTETINYFEKYSSVNLNIGTPYPVNGSLELFDYTGLIGITGQRKGCLYLSTSADLLVDIAKEFLQEENVDAELLLDVIGEVANSIAGNAQQASEKVFDISVPVLFKGKVDKLKYQGEFPIYAVPFNLGSQKGILVVGLKDDE